MCCLGVMLDTLIYSGGNSHEGLNSLLTIGSTCDLLLHVLHKRQ